MTKLEELKAAWVAAREAAACDAELAVSKARESWDIDISARNI